MRVAAEGVKECIVLERISDVIVLGFLEYDYLIVVLILMYIYLYVCYRFLFFPLRRT